jgi:catechol 2,3-dioxygenase-like lactoylglutathione lyase family enzyme
LTAQEFRVVGLDHVQIAIPKGQEEEARRFYCDVLGLRELAKPEALRSRGGFWLLAGEWQVHVGVEDGGCDRAATKAHVAYRVVGVDAWRERLRRLGIATIDSVPIPGYRRCELRDPFGNRVELIEVQEREEPV